MTLLSLQEQEDARQKRLRVQMREAEQLRFADPDPVDFELTRVWAAHAWTELDGVPQWVFAGFRRRRSKRKPQSMNKFFSKVRRQLGIDKRAPVMLMDLGNAQRAWKADDQSWRYKPPARQAPKPKMEQRTPKPIGKTTKRRAKVRAYKLSKKHTKFVALGRNAWDRAPHYLYLGPLSSTQKRQAQFEARRLFPMWNEMLVLETSELSKPLRAAMASGKRVRAGSTRIQWPEVPPSFDGMLEKFIKRTNKRDMHGMISADDPRWQTVAIALHSEWVAQDKPWLSLGWFRKQINSWSPKACVKSRRKSKRSRRVSAATTVKKSKRSARKRAPVSKPRTRTLRSIVRKVRAVLHRKTVLHIRTSASLKKSARR